MYRYILFFLFFLSVLSKAQNIVEDTIVLNRNVHSDTLLEYVKSYEQYHDLLSAYNYERYVEKEQKYQVLNIDDFIYTIISFKLKKNKYSVDIYRSGYLQTPEPLYGIFFKANQTLILIYVYLPYLSSDKEEKLKILNQIYCSILLKQEENTQQKCISNSGL